MKLSSLVNVDYIHLGLKADSLEEIIDKALDTFERGKRLPVERKVVRQAILDREKLGTTAMPSGLAIPHARFEGYNDVCISICVPEKPVTVAGEAVKFFAVILTSQTASNIYLQTLASLAKVSTDEENFAKVVNAKTPEAILEVFSEYEVKKNLTVADIMSTTVYSVSPKYTLKELADLFFAKNLTYVPVVDEKGDFIGEVTIQELLQVGIPNYAMMIGNLNFLSTFEPLESLLEHENNIVVAEIMRKPRGKLKPETSIVEAALELTQGRYRHLSVVEKGRLVGVLSVTDILTKILRR